ncbi:MAG: universal stress protein [bacterium TMED144]|nr:MAG: universal stress protein [bacterium TMED144]|tara:strand:+ start:902 stop:1786 length:885 start_codon:yes stop_codon:yes gene_type:complete
MNILIAISSKHHSEPTLKAGMKVANAFNASSTVLEVGEKINEFSMKEVYMARERIESWNFDRPGVDVLEWAFNFLCKEKLINDSSIEKGFPKNTLVENSSRRSEVFLEKGKAKNISLIIRNGDIIEELRNEVQSGYYDVTILGGSKSGNLSFDMVQYIESSIFIVKNFQTKKKNKILLAVDSSKGSKKAIKYCVGIADAFNIEVDIITVTQDVKLRKVNQNMAEYASKFLRKFNIKNKIILEEGNPVDVIPKKAGNNHILVIGSSSRGPIKTFFQSSTPIKILKKCNCPILVVK